MDGRADEERRRLRAALEQELRVVHDVLLAPVRSDLPPRRPEQADGVVLWAVTTRSDGIEQQWVESPGRLDGRSAEVGVLAVGVAPGEDRLHPALRLFERADVAIGQPEDASDHGDRQEPSEILVELECRETGETGDAIHDDRPDRAHGQLRDRVRAPGMRQRSVEGLVLATHERTEVAPPDDLSGPRQ